MEKKTRKLKVYSASVQTGNGSWYRGNVYKQVPQIGLQGDWLQECGFETGSNISVECQAGKLVISKN